MLDKARKEMPELANLIGTEMTKKNFYEDKSILLNTFRDL